MSYGRPLKWNQLKVALPLKPSPRRRSDPVLKPQGTSKELRLMILGVHFFDECTLLNDDEVLADPTQAVIGRSWPGLFHALFGCRAPIFPAGAAAIVRLKLRANACPQEKGRTQY